MKSSCGGLPDVGTKVFGKQQPGEITHRDMMYGRPDKYKSNALTCGLDLYTLAGDSSQFSSLLILVDHFHPLQHSLD